MLIDNVFRMSSSIPTVTAFFDNTVVKSLFSFGNTFTSPIPPQSLSSSTFQGEIYAADDVVVDPSQIADVQIPTNVYIPPNRNRIILEVPGSGTGADIQQQINNAVAHGYAYGVIHVQAGLHAVGATIQLPKDLPLMLIGDDSFLSKLGSVSNSSDPLIESWNPDSVIKDIHLDGGSGVRPEGIRLHVYDQPGSHVLIDQAQLQGGNDIAVNFDGLEHANVEMFSAYTQGAITGVRLTGGVYRNAGVGTTGTTNFYNGSLQSSATSTSFDVSAHGKFLVQDNWHDAGESGPRNFTLSGSGTVTEQVGEVATTASQPFEIDNFDGKISLIGLQFNGGFRLQPGSSKTQLLNLGLDGQDPNYQPASNANLEVHNVLNAYYSQGGHQLQPSDQPDALWMRSMLAQTRSEYPVRRQAMGSGLYGGHRTRVERVQVKNTTQALHMIPASVSSGMGYAFTNGSGLITGFPADQTNECGAPGPAREVPLAFFKAVQNDEGDFSFTDPTGNFALGVITYAIGNQSLMMVPTGSGYEQRWRVESLGDGRMALWNRALNTALSRTPGQCLSLAPSAESDSSKWVMGAK